ncbi:SDR family NAD(P)-dependent oxidoreductase [Halomonas halmophila]|uniref:Oxidoreductase n=1 Tax=Halomonas halmophila TaxID=252 RepID=A0A4Y4EXZ5_9GAMM|nr:SDR family NAD(P)-dependent oxidoreductase [Halomonas halmophila]GED22729.1 oxidoreductase [Halomonas halmophila]
MTARSLLITGATGAIGGALARHYAAPGVRLILHGRRAEPLEALAQACHDAGAEVELSRIDLTDDTALEAWLGQLALPDVVIANAGQNIHAEDGAEMEDWQATSRLLDINLRTPMAMARHLAPRMIERGHGQLVFLSSLAAWHGLPLTPSYSASKAGIKAYGEALRGWLAPRGVGVTVVMPGYVSSQMCHDMPGPKPWQIDADSAARRIARGIEHNRARVSFPFPLNLGCWCLGVMPAGLAQPILRLMGYGRST